VNISTEAASRVSMCVPVTALSECNVCLLLSHYSVSTNWAYRINRTKNEILTLRFRRHVSAWNNFTKKHIL